MKKLLLFFILISTTAGICFARDVSLNFGMSTYSIRVPYDTDGIISEDSYTVLGPRVDVTAAYNPLVLEWSAELVITADSNFRYGKILDVNQYYQDRGLTTSYIRGTVNSFNTYFGVGFLPVNCDYITMALTAGVTESTQFQVLDVYGPRIKNGDIDESVIVDETRSYFYTTCGLASKVDLTFVFDKYGYGLNLFGFMEKELFRTKWTGSVSTIYSPVYRYGGGVAIQIFI